MEEIKYKRRINQKMVQEFILLLDLFLKTNKSDIELSEMTGISSSTVGRRLLDKDLMFLAFPDKSLEEINELYSKIKNLRQDNLKQAKTLGGQNSILNNAYYKDEQGHFAGSGKLSLKIFSEDIDFQNKLLWHIAHTFGLHLDTLSKLLGISSHEINSILCTTRPEFFQAHKFLTTYDKTDQSIAVENFLSFYYQYLKAVKERNANQRKELLGYVTDSDVIKLRAKRKNEGTNMPINDEDIKIILKYQLKYCLTVRDVITYCCVDYGHYKYKLSEYLSHKENEFLKNRYLSLANFIYNERGVYNNAKCRY